MTGSRSRDLALRMLIVGWQPAQTMTVRVTVCVVMPVKPAVALYFMYSTLNSLLTSC
jgi:hypothetical protein